VGVQRLPLPKGKRGASPYSKGERGASPYSKGERGASPHPKGERGGREAEVGEPEGPLKTIDTTVPHEPGTTHVRYKREPPPQRG